MLIWHGSQPLLLVLTILLLSACRSANVDPHRSIEGSTSIPAATPLSHLPEPLVIGVLPFDIATQQDRFRWLRRGFPELLTTDLAAAGTLRLIDHARLAAIDQEVLRQYRGQTSDVELVQVGRQLGTTLLLNGTITELSATDIRIDVRLTAVETAELLGSISRITPISELLATERDIAWTLLQLLRAQPTGAHLAQWTRPQPRLLSAVQAYTDGLDALRAQDRDGAKRAFETTLHLAPDFYPAQEALADPRLTDIIVSPWSTDTASTAALPIEPTRAIDQLLRELLAYGLRVTIDPPHAQPLLRVTVHAALHPAWIERFATVALRLELGPFVRDLAHPTRSIRLIKDGPLLPYLTDELRALTLTLTFWSSRNDPLTRLGICLADGTHPHTPVMVVQGSRPMLRFQSAAPFSVVVPLPPTLWSQIHYITPVLTFNHAVCDGSDRTP